METTQLENNFTINIEKAKQIDRNTNLKEKWYGLNATNNVGCCTYLYKKYNYPKTYNEFYEAYIKDHSVNDKQSGRNEYYIYKIAKELSNRDNHRFEISDYYSYIVKKIIVDTLEGAKKESEINEMLIKKGLTTVSPTLDEDLKLGIDLKVYKNNKLLYMVQVKPNTFFIGNNNHSLINDRINAINKEQMVMNIYHVPTIYIIYNKNSGKFIKHNGKLSHRLLNLINTDGTTKNKLNN